MINNIDITKILFLDLECVSEKADYSELDETFQSLWAHKGKGILRKDNPNPTEEDIAAVYKERAAISAEFGKIICISVGFISRGPDKQIKVRLKSFASDDEAELLKDFCELLKQHYNYPSTHFLCGHNIREFDIPYICRRLVVNQLEFPNLLQLHGKKPWETKYMLDTLELWKFGDYKSYTSLKLLAATLGFLSPKDDIDGSEVGRVYWEEKDLERIAVYCEKDVLATVQLFMRFVRLPLITEDQVIYVGRD